MSTSAFAPEATQLRALRAVITPAFLPFTRSELSLAVDAPTSPSLLQSPGTQLHHPWQAAPIRGESLSQEPGKGPLSQFHLLWGLNGISRSRLGSGGEGWGWPGPGGGVGLGGGAT